MDGRRRRVSWASLARFGPGGARFQDGREMLQRVERSLIWARGRSVACADSFGGMSGYQRERGRAQYALVRATGWRGRTGGLALLGHVGAHWDGDRAPCACARGSRRGPGRSWRPGGASRVARRGATHVGEPAAVYCRHLGPPRRGALRGRGLACRPGSPARKALRTAPVRATVRARRFKARPDEGGRGL